MKRIREELGLQDGMKNGSDYKSLNSGFQISANLGLEKQKSSLPKVNSKELKSRVNIVDDFLSGKLLTYLEYFGLLSNLIPLHGGVALYKKTLNEMIELNKNSPEFQKELQKNPNLINKLLNLPSILKQYDYVLALEAYSPYEEDHIYPNLLKASKKYEVTRISLYSTISLVEAEKRFNKEFNLALKADDTKLHIFKVATGLGKTKMIEPLLGVLSAFPTNDLKNQVLGRIHEYNLSNGIYNHVKVTPELPKNLPSSLAEEIDSLYAKSANLKVNQLLARKAENDKGISLYLRQKVEAYQSDDTVCTTHHQALHGKFNHPIYIFDEDPILTLLAVDCISTNDLLDGLNILKVSLHDNKCQKLINAYIDSLTKGIKDACIENKKDNFKALSLIKSEVLENEHKYKGNLLGFLDSIWYVLTGHSNSTVSFIKSRPLPSNKKIIILSATVEEWIYRKLYGDRVIFHDISNVEIQGMIDQHSNYSFTRTRLENERCLAYAIEQVGDLPTLTYKSEKHLFSNSVEKMHFGKLTGFDDLNGQDIAVVGMYYLNPTVYQLFASALGIEFQPQDLTMKFQVIERNGIRFPLTTFEHQGLRDLHLFFLESEQEQAIGRPRLIRNNALVKLLSRLIHPQACLTEEEKVLGRRRIKENREVELRDRKLMLEDCLEEYQIEGNLVL